MISKRDLSFVVCYFKFAIVVNLACELFGVEGKILRILTSTWQQRFANAFTPGQKPGFQ